MPAFASPALPLLKYGIREIVDIANELKKLDRAYNLVWENIGDPVAKGWPVPPFLKEIIKEEIDRPGDKIFGYSHSRGNPIAREWVAEHAKRFAPTSKLTAEDVLFTSGLGSSIAVLYQMLKPGSRIIQPTPAYPTHSSFESFSAGQKTISYNLDPQNNWQPDLKHLEKQLNAHPETVGLLIINPNNPTGAVYNQDTLEKMVALAKQHQLFIISDEIYFRMVFNGHQHIQITQLAADRVPLIVLRGISKDIPWPGGRSGWMEFHNSELDKNFGDYCAAVKQRVLMEVCSTTLPQTTIPKLYDHPKFAAWNQAYNSYLEKIANEIADTLALIPELIVNRTNGAFYMMPLFKDGALTDKQTLPIKNSRAKEYIETLVSGPNFPLDKRFTYYLLAATGIVVVPASDFFSPHAGFRITTLDKDPARRQDTYQRISQAVKNYLAS